MKEKYYNNRKKLLHLLDGKILDLGCNYGDFHNAFFDRDVYGVDLEITNYKKKMIQADCTYLPFKNNTFDSVFAGELIEHLQSPQNLVHEIKRVTKRNGLVIFTTPNIHSLAYIRAKLFNKETLSDDKDLSHLHSWDLKLFSRYLSKSFFCLESGYTDPDIDFMSIIIHEFRPDFSWFIYYIGINLK